MILKIKCPHCSDNIKIVTKRNKIISVEIDGTINLSQEEIKRVLDSMNIEFGTLEGGENSQYE